jgi:cytoskeletal protein CcmA (bactofilin family)
MPSGRPDYSVTVYGTVAITGGVVVTGTVAISGTVTVTGAVTVTGTVAISGTVTVTGAVTVTGTVAISGTVTVSGAVTVTGSVTVSGTVAISGTVTVSGAVTVTGSVTVSGTVAISGTVTVSGAVTVTGTVSISGTVTISGSVSITGTVTISGAVTITSGAVTISTSGGTNIIIDKLLQGAFVGRYFSLQNDNGVTTPTAPPCNNTGGTYRGKFFPRGCRGFLGALFIYSKRTAAGTITLSFSPQPGMGAVQSITITPGANWDWATLGVLKTWNYDSLFVWISACSADVSWGYADTNGHDFLSSSDSGATWSPAAVTMYIRADIYLATVGDLPVSGTVNNVRIPSVGSATTNSGVAVGAGATVTVQTLAGAGRLLLARLEVATAVGAENTQWSIYCDGVLVLQYQPIGLNGDGATATTPGIQLMKYGSGAYCAIWVQLPLEFRREFKVTAYNAAAQTVTARTTLNLIG